MGLSLKFREASRDGLVVELESFGLCPSRGLLVCGDLETFLGCTQVKADGFSEIMPGLLCFLKEMTGAVTGSRRMGDTTGDEEEK